jgi:soluble lytic murein transglycosylase-like protein
MTRRDLRRSDPKGTRLPRRQAWLLVALAALLALDGPPPVGQVSSTPEAAALAPVGSGPSDSGEAIGRVLRRANPTLSLAEVERIGDAVLRYGAKYRIDPELVTAVLLVESGARPWAVSPKGARGLMQVMPHMLRPMGMVGNLSTIETNIEAGCIILADNIRRLGEADGISAYFWGSEIRGEGYLERVQAARARLRGFATSS